MSCFVEVEKFIKNIYQGEPAVLHRPAFLGNEKKYLSECIDSNFVSSVGVRVDDFEARIVDYTGAKYAIAVVNGTSALHIALKLAGVATDTEVITQALTFVATCNAVCYLGASPVFVDVERGTLGMCPRELRCFLETHAERSRGGVLWNKTSGKRISACVPMHTFGHPCRIDEIAAICAEYGLPLVEDSAESLGSFFHGRHTGTFGLMGVLSFNGNKIISTGGGGMIVTDDSIIAARAKHITTTAKIQHRYEYVHDEVGYNYRLPNLNAALGCAQMEQLEYFVKIKRRLAEKYREFFQGLGVTFFGEPENCTSNYWLNALVLESLEERDAFLEHTNRQGVMTRPAWRLMSKLPMFKNCQNDGLKNSLWLEERLVNIPSCVPMIEAEDG
jgi:perosamine synthetase